MQRNLIVREHTGLENTSDMELIEDMALGDFDKKSSSEAFAEFHRRYAQILYTTCYYICRTLPNQDEAAADITENVLIKALSYASSYNPNRASVKTWLNGIAQNEFNNYYSEFRQNHPIAPELGTVDDLSLVVDDGIPIDRSKINGQSLERALNLLTPMEKDVVMTHMFYKDVDNLDSQIPDDVMKDLCGLYKKKPATIRKIKSRAISKIKSSILNQ
jgi:RNA polymerase sigma factor (sigma-70 family)